MMLLMAVKQSEKQHSSPFKESLHLLPESVCASPPSLSLSTTCDVTDKEFPSGETAGRLWLISDNI